MKSSFPLIACVPEEARSVIGWASPSITKQFFYIKFLFVN